MYAQVGDSRVIRGPLTVPLMQFFFKSQIPGKAGTLCMDQVYIYARRGWGGFVSASLTYGPRHVQQCTQFSTYLIPSHFQTYLLMYCHGPLKHV